MRPAPQILGRPEAFLIRRHRRWFVQILSVALLLAQLGVAVHASAHLKSDLSSGAQACGQCLSHAPLQNMVGGGANVVADVAAVRVPAFAGTTRGDAPHPPFSAFRSRAPPELL